MLNIAQIEKLLREGITLQQNNELESALQKYDEVLKILPEQIDALYFKSLILIARLEWEDAFILLEQAVATSNPHANPQTLAKCHTALGSVCQQLERLDDAEGHFRQALDLDTPTADRWIDLAQCLIYGEKHAEAEAAVSEARKIDPQNIRVLSAQAELCWRSWQVAKCVDYLQQAVRIDPTNLDLVSQYLFALNYLDDTAEHNAAAEHVMIGEALQGYYRANIPEPEASERTGPLHIGFLSPDLKQHSVAYFLLSLLQGLQWTSNLETYCYSTSAKDDSMTARLRFASDHFQIVQPKDLEKAIREDTLDILFDLAGHSARNSLPVLLTSPKLAPVYINWLGYANTTGFPLFDYRIVDRITDPEDSADPASERLLYLDPCFLCYSPPDEAPEVNPLPTLSEPFVTFGCLNNLNKVTPTMIETWIALLSLDSRYRLLLKSPMFRSASVCDSLRNPFQRTGIDPERLILLNRTEDVQSHLAVYHRIDLSLDTFPYHGTTTTLESLYMGCPVITLSGASHRSRVSKSLLNTLGRSEWVVECLEDYVDTAHRLVQNPAELNRIRQSLRGDLLASALCNKEAFATRFTEQCRLIIRR